MIWRFEPSVDWAMGTTGPSIEKEQSETTIHQVIGTRGHDNSNWEIATVQSDWVIRSTDPNYGDRANTTSG